MPRGEAGNQTVDKIIKADLIIMPNVWDVLVSFLPDTVSLLFFLLRTMNCQPW